MTTDMSANNIRDAIKTYMNSQGVNTVVTKRTYDSSDVATTTSADIAKISFKIEVDRMVTTPTTSAMTIFGSTSTATITLDRNA